MTEKMKELDELFQRDLERLYVNVEKIPQDDLWRTKPGITNSCGVLAQHIIGNLKFFVGSVLGDTDYERDRELEFTNTGKSGESLLKEIEETAEMVSYTFKKVDANRLEKPYPLDIPFDYSTYKFLIHLYGHLDYHTGQINYLKRILGGNKS